MNNAGPGRPRGKDYEKNLAKRNRIEQSKEIQLKTSKVNEKLISLAKSWFNQVNSAEIAGRQPIYTYDQTQQMRDGINLRPSWRIPISNLRNASYATSLISAIHTVRVEDLSRFARISSKSGLWFRMEDEDLEVTDEILQRMKSCGRWFDKMGDLTPGWANRDHLVSVFEMMLRDTLTIDSIAYYLIFNSFGKLIEMKYLDPGTIFTVDSAKGYRGDKSIAFVQIIDDNVVETFGPNEILYLHKNHLSDVTMRGFGFSPLEACMLDLVGVIRSLKFNRDTFSRQHPPGYLSLQGDISQDGLESLQLQWQEMISGLDDSHRIPIIATSAGEVKWTPLNIPNEMVFKELLQWCVSLVLMGHGMDQAELGLRLIGSQSLSEANQTEKSKLSLTRAKLSLLNYFESAFSKLKSFREDDFGGIVCEFTGKDPEDEKDKIQKYKDEVSNWKLLDEIRIEQDEPTIGETLSDLYGVSSDDYKLAGAVILNPVFQQNLQMIRQETSYSGYVENPETEYEDPDEDLSFEENEESNFDSQEEENPEKDLDLVF
ncbi:phage portal protein [Leptospira sp. FAT2]|uniref:phage portal protein n=1 Tax=Leptospira sanjuanensis TaxID=2879643 RepID=UPI001EE8A8FB|nr:phage portal protein [Leptospira sanjuanensis]MCG6195610.1 phage portal protein [Leptospira sanjuanensis]